jgi:rfaE bifunctional protein nucleotidyltransferase chain/domain
MTENKIKNIESLLHTVQKWKEENQDIVFTNGCFDILHLGHIDYLEKSALLGDKLIVAVNTDLSVRTLKGETRPLNNEYSRARLLAALGFVDAVILFGEETPLELIQKISPAILVKGDDYQIQEIVGGDFVKKNGGQVKTISLVKGYSTTNLIQKIQNEVR